MKTTVNLFKIISAFLFVIIFHNVIAQDFQWIKTIGGMNYDEGRAIVTDNNGNSYITGYFQDTVDFDPGPGVYNLVANGMISAFIVKLDPNGNFIWAKQFVGSSGVESITIDDNGNIYLTGSFEGTVDFDPGAGVYNLTALGNSDIFITKLDTSGNLVWAKQIGGVNDERSFSIKLDHNNNIYTTGHFFDTTDFDPGIGTFNLIPSGAPSIFVSKWDPNGDFVWAKQFDNLVPWSLNWNMGFCVDIDNNEHVYVTGAFEDSIDFDPGAGVFNLISSGYSDIFVAKLDVNGSLLWARQIGGAYSDNSHSIVVDESENVYISGFFSDTVDFDPGPNVYNLVSKGSNDAFISKLDSNGDFVWVKRFGSVNLDQSFSLAIDADKYIYITGYFGDTVDFDPGPNVYNLISKGSNDAFISKLDSSGNFVWAERLGGNSSELGFNLALDNNRNIYVTGYIDGGDTTNFTPGGGTFILYGTRDIFVVKYSQCNVTNSTISPIACYNYMSPSGNYIWTASGTYMDTLINVAGCDSIITINLTITNSTTSTITPVVCGSYTSPSGNYIWTTSGIYIDTVSNVAGCDSIITINLTIDTVDVSVIDSITSDYEPLLTANATNASYQWVSCPDYLPVSGATNQTFLPSTNGNYAVIVTQNNCTDTSQCITITNVGIDNRSMNSIELYPNPHKGQFTITLPKSIAVSEIQVMDTVGKIVYSSSNVKDSKFTVNLQSLSEGIYYVSIVTKNEGKKVFKVVQIKY